MPPKPMVFAGLDHVRAAVNGGVVGLVGALATFAVPHAWWPGLAAGTALAAAILGLARYRLSVSPRGVVWTQLALWVIPVARRRYGLDATVEIYQSWEADQPEGVCVRGSLLSDEGESECFGPSFSQPGVHALHAAANRAIFDARAQAPTAPRELRHSVLTPQLDRLDLAHAGRSPLFGRLTRLATTGPVQLRDVELPQGSILELNDDGFIDPSRPDVLRGVQVADGVRLRHGLELPAETRLHFDHQGRIRWASGPLPAELEIGGRWIDGREGLAWDEAGELTGFVLARETEVAGQRLPAGTKFSSLRLKIGDGGWGCTLGGTLALPDLTLDKGERLDLSIDGRRLAGALIARERPFAGGRLVAGYVRLRGDGSVDREVCRRRGSWTR